MTLNSVLDLSLLHFLIHKIELDQIQVSYVLLFTFHSDLCGGYCLSHCTEKEIDTQSACCVVDSRIVVAFGIPTDPLPSLQHIFTLSLTCRELFSCGRRVYCFSFCVNFVPLGSYLF